MEKKQITIVIGGEAGVGKTRISYLLKEFLKSKGLNVKYELGIDFQSEEHLNIIVGTDIDKAIDAFKDTREITIREVQHQKAHLV